MFARTINKLIKEKINSGKAIVVVGARQVGKTTLLNEILKDKDYLFLDADDPTIRQLFLLRIFLLEKSLLLTCLSITLLIM